MRDLKSVLYFSVHGSSKSVEELADALGVSASYIYKSCLDGQSGSRFPLDLLIPLMEATGDYSVLDHLNARCGRVTASVPRVAKLKLRDPHVITEVQRHFNATMAEVLEFFSNPRPKKIAQVLKALHTHLCEVAALMRAVKDFNQREMF